MSALHASNRVFHLLGPCWSRTFRCVWMFEELGIPYTLVQEALPVSKLARKYSPTGKVPILLEFTSPADDTQPDLTLSESVAINTYLGDCYPESNLVPRPGTRDRALYDQYVCCILSELDSQGLWIHRKHQAMGQYFGYIPDAVSHAQHQFQRFNQQMVSVLKNGGPFLLGNQFTAADVLYVHCLDWSKSIGWLSDLDNGAAETVELYRNVCHARKAFQQASNIRKESKASHKL
ncbi:predicted protein [Phaeodactylum tricornutum CCAP 1055/1]|jgi:glutathione S-transferase|uniref:GST N-terminal domain-containing protein n=1 Tax=Phaeodactylum tricornutum (strain CCAP 1055/1) TaxID=556484 RepID=B7GCS3_PHATC|nr:predicted protein [Phaeodactylum tricornutum CCAP 1055/1]EEC43669.1 predicted protein [Phaeodactylum tricornutum CCAP 1055/1]|eukprot:XP_002184933.1 predicted protein [Phaeodactylum tricornutum CCAP 1055/1]